MTTYGSAWVNPLVVRLTEKDEQRLVDELKVLIEENYALGGSQHGFLFQGVFNTLLLKSRQRASEKHLLVPALHDRGKAYMENVKLLQKEQTRLGHGLHLVMRDCQTAQDVRDALPDSASMFMQEIKGLPRTRPEGWTLNNNPLHLHDYDQVREIFRFYAANQLIY